MAYGDDRRARNQIDYQGDFAQEGLTNLRQGATEPLYSKILGEYYGPAADRQMADYGDIMNQYKSIAGSFNPNVQADSVNYQRSPEMQSAMSGYQNFADTGGFSEGDIGSMRARAISPIRSVYSNAQNELKRQRALQGGYSPNYTAATAKMAGGLAGQISDRVSDTNAQLAQMIQSGKLSGLGGLGNLSTQDTQFGQNAQLANQSARLQAAGMNQNANQNRLQAVAGQASLFGTTPGLASTFGNHTMQALGSNLESQQMQNQLGLGIMNAQNQAAQIPGRTDVVLGNIGKGMDLAKKGAEFARGF